MDPERRVALVAAAEEGDPLVDQRRGRRRGRRLVERATVDVAAFDEEVWEGAGRAELAELRPQAPLEHGRV